MQTDDLIAGLFLLLFGFLGITLYLAITYSMIRMSNEIVGFRFLISQAISDILLMFQFGVWPGILILLQDDLLPESTRWYLHVYLDFTWWAMVYHYSVVAWSRLAAVQWPNWFRTLPTGSCVLICMSAWFLGLVQSLVEHQFSWFTHLYYQPAGYGLDADWPKYISEGTGNYYMACNVTLMILPFPFYGAALYVLFKRQRKRIVDTRSRTSRVGLSMSPAAFQAQRQLSIETRLMIPCIINTLLFVLGQIVIFLCPKNNKWMNWLLMVVFLSNSVANPLLYLFFSSVIRKHVFLDCRAKLSLSAIYNDYDYRSNSSTHRQSLLQHKRDTTVSSDLNRYCTPKISIT